MFFACRVMESFDSSIANISATWLAMAAMLAKRQGISKEMTRHQKILTSENSHTPYAQLSEEPQSHCQSQLVKKLSLKVAYKTLTP